MGQVKSTGQLGLNADIATVMGMSAGGQTRMSTDLAKYLQLGVGAQIKASDFYGVWKPQIGGDFVNNMPSYPSYNSTSSSQIGCIIDESNGVNAGCQWQWQNALGEWWEMADNGTDYQYTAFDEAGDSNFDPNDYYIKWQLISGSINGYTTGWDSGDGYVTANGYKYLALWDVDTNPANFSEAVFDIYIANSVLGAGAVTRRFYMKANRLS